MKDNDEFVTLLSHELKTPLTPLKAIAQLLRARMKRSLAEGTPLDLEAFDRNLATIERQVDRMSAMVNDLLDVSRAGRGRFDLNVADTDLVTLLQGVVTRAVDANAVEGDRHRFDLKAPERLVAKVDQLRIEQVLRSLIGNAVKFSPQGGVVEIGLERKDSAAVITVRDNGIGILAADLVEIGKPFVRGSGRAATYSGIGTGFYLAKLIAERHDGTVEIESDGEDQGTTVQVTLPIR